MKKTDCKQDYFERCMKVCRKAGETVENCIYGCAAAAKHLCTYKTKLRMGPRAFNTEIETESKTKGWLLVVIFTIIVSVIILKFII